MNAAVLLVSVLVCAFMTVGNAYDSVRCNDVTGIVGKEVVFACSVPERITKNCVELYKFQYPVKYNGSTICRQESSDDFCEKRSIFTCRYTPHTAMKETFRFFVHGGSWAESEGFTVEISEPLRRTEAHDVCSLSCNDVTGTVGNEVTLTCSIPQQCTECCIHLYKFQYPEKYNDSAICKQELPGGVCEQKTSFTCRYTSNTAIKETFRFLLQTFCGVKRSEFTVEISGPSEKQTDIEGQGSKSSIVAAVSCFIIIIIIIIICAIVAIMYVKNKCFKSTNAAALQITERGAEQAMMTTNDL